MISLSIYEKLSEAVMAHDDVALITIVSHSSNLNETQIGTKCLLQKDGKLYDENRLSIQLQNEIRIHCLPLLEENKTKTIVISVDDFQYECYVEIFQSPHHLIVAGAGHVSEPVAKIGKMLDFYVTVIDDRAAFANRERFPNVDEVVCSSYLEYFRNVPITPKTYILLLTRGHKFDVISLQSLLKREEKIKVDKRTKYIGMIGSRRRIAGVFEQLQDEFTEHNFKNIYSPVGLDLGAQSPEEIAISIMAEILKVKNKTSGNSLKNKIRSYSSLKFIERKEQVKR